MVVASNFAPGTTSADIQSAVDNAGLAMESCRVVTAYPTVMAELLFADKPSAENCIANFNNRTVWWTHGFVARWLTRRGQADGRLLHVYLKQGGPTPIVPTRAAPPAPERAPPRDLIPRTARDHRPTRDVDGARRADPEFQDGRYGFEASSRDNPVDVDMEVDEGEYEVRLDDYRGGDDRYGGGEQQRPRDPHRRDYEPRYRAAPDHEPREVYRSQEKSRPGGGMEGRRLYSDDLYAQRGRGFR